jgi:aminoglycoside phosphotransferase (APT) family kinase protein
VSTSEAEALEALRAVNAQREPPWELDGRLEGGFQSGAWRLRSADRSAAVLKVAVDRRWASQVVRAERSVRVVRAAGYPTPAWLAVGVTATGIGYQVQELASGRSIRTIGTGEAQQLADVLEQQGDVDPDPERCWSDFITDMLTRGFDGLCSTVSAVDPAGADLVGACRRLRDASLHDLRLPTTDMVHGDFRLSNVLFDGQRVSGVVDIEAIGSGTRAFDYATLLDHPRIEPAALQLLVQAGVAAAGAAVLQACFALVALDLVRFMSRASAAAETDALTGRIRALTKRADEIELLATG